MTSKNSWLKAFRTKTEQVGNEVLADLIKRMDKTNLLKMAGPKN